MSAHEEFASRDGGDLPTRGAGPADLQHSNSAGGSASRQLPFTVLGRYEVRERIGAGGMGDVYLAQDLELNRSVAIKWVRGELAQSPQALQRFYQEAKAAAALNHPGIVQIYDRCTDDGDQFIVMEYVAGESLAERLKRGPLDLDECVRIVAAMCDALQAAHDNGIVHRDIKPANILLGVDGTAKLTDFGVARLGTDSEMTIAGTTVGTPVYMAPEQEKSSDQASPQADQYSLAATLYHLLTGESPARILERRIPDVLRDVLVRGTEPDPPLRFPTIADFKLAMADATGISVAGVTSEQASGNALDTLKKQKERVHRIHEAARRLAYEQHDWPLARTTLQQIPESARDTELWQEVNDKAEQVESLTQNINKAVEQMQWKGLNLPIEELIVLQPHRTDLKDLLAELDESDILTLDQLKTFNASDLDTLATAYPTVSTLKEVNRESDLHSHVVSLLDLDDIEMRAEMLAPLSEWLRCFPNHALRPRVTGRRKWLIEQCVQSFLETSFVKNPILLQQLLSQSSDPRSRRKERVGEIMQTKWKPGIFGTAEVSIKCPDVKISFPHVLQSLKKDLLAASPHTVTKCEEYWSARSTFAARRVIASILAAIATITFFVSFMTYDGAYRNASRKMGSFYGDRASFMAYPRYSDYENMTREERSIVWDEKHVEHIRDDQADAAVGFIIGGVLLIVAFTLFVSRTDPRPALRKAIELRIEQAFPSTPQRYNSRQIPESRWWEFGEE